MDYFSHGGFYILAALGFGFVIFIHELGHFLFAKWAGVRVDRFSIGFGPVIFKHTIGETEYALSLFPLGGYVKMLGQEDLPSEVPEENRVNPRSYLAKSATWKALILFAGVLFNLVSSYIILLCLAWHGMPIIEPIVGDVRLEVVDSEGRRTPSAAVKIGLHRGDRILTFNGKTVRSFDDLSMEVVTAGTEPLHVLVERHESDGTTRTLMLPEDGAVVTVGNNAETGRPDLGIDPPHGHVITVIDFPTSAPASALHVKDRLVAINGKTIPEALLGQDIDDLLAPWLGKDVALTVEPGNRTITVRYAGNGAGASADSGLSLALPTRLDRIVAGSAAQTAGLKPGDIPIKVDGQEVGGVGHFISLTRAALNAGRDFTLTVLRDGEERTVTVHGTAINGHLQIGALVSEMHGYLPIIPKAYDGQPSALSLAKIVPVVPGDALVGEPKEQSSKDKHLHDYYVVSRGKPYAIPLPLDDYLKLMKSPSDSPFLHLFSKSPGSLYHQLVDTRVDSTGDGHGYPHPDAIHLAGADEIKKSVDLHGLSAATVTALLTTLKPGDWITGETVLGDDRHALEVVRGADAKPRIVTVEFKDPGIVLVLGPTMVSYKLHDWTESFTMANMAAYGMVVKTVQIIPRFFRSSDAGGIDANKSLTGPIGIFSALEGSAERFGFDSYLNLIALIGLNLFLVNLLPIPITDGGQLVFLAIETAIGRPLPALARIIATWIGLIMVLALMLYVISLDIMRHTGQL